MRSLFVHFAPLALALACAMVSCKKKSQEGPAEPPATAGAGSAAGTATPEPAAADAASAGEPDAPAGPTPPGPAAADPGAGGGSTITIGGPASDDETRQARAWLDAGLALAKQHQCERALAEGFEKVVAFYEQRHDPTKTKIRCGRTSVAGLGAGLEAALGGGDVTVVGAEWCDALFYKAYCLVELQRLPAAEEVLVRACEMLPDDPMYLAELGDVQQRQGKSEAAMATFERAMAAANGLAEEPDAADRSPGGRPPVQWQTRALRGIGYALVELGRLEDARASYRRALDLDPNDEASQKELAFIAEKLAGAAP